MYDSFSEGRMYYGRSVALIGFVIAAALLSVLL